MKYMTSFAFTPIKIKTLKIPVTYNIKIKINTIKYLLYIIDSILFSGV